MFAQDDTRLPVGLNVIVVDVADKVVAIAANVDVVLNVVNGDVLVVEVDVVDVVKTIVVDTTVGAGPSF